MKCCVISHTHWDREWFADARITSKWLVTTFQNLLKIFEERKDFIFVLDGQTLILEDLLTEDETLRDQIRNLVKKRKLFIGPCYCQIDWRISPEEAVIKNFEIGIDDARQFGGHMKVGWFLDNFGHISQIPQIMNMFNLNGAFLWRGVNLPVAKTEFLWNRDEAGQLWCVFLLGGYRNLYNLKQTQPLAEKRLHHEIEKLSSFTYGDVVLLDGYDLETHPEDPLEYVSGENVVRTDPERFVNSVKSRRKSLPVVNGEMISGKYASVFPGTLSTRVYLKLESDVVYRLLTRTEVLNSLLEKHFEKSVWKEYLKTLNHDNICGVCTDFVHRSMERSYRKLYSFLANEFTNSAASLISKSGLESGRYVLSFSPFEYDVWYSNGKTCYKLRSSGIGIFKITDHDANRKGKRALKWKNRYYQLHFEKDGSIIFNGIKAGVFLLEKDLGDTYSSDPKEMEFDVCVLDIHIASFGNHHMIVKMKRKISTAGGSIVTDETIVLDETPLVKWSAWIDTTSMKSNYRLSLLMETDDDRSTIFAKTPFDIVKRPRVDTDLFSNELPQRFKGVLLAAREKDTIRDFPFQGFVCLSDEKKSTGVFAKALREYSIDEKGVIRITLVRAVDWIAKEKVSTRTGDAGPRIFVPGARCKGKMRFDLAFISINSDVRSEEFFRWYQLFENEPVRVDVKNSQGILRELSVYSGNLPYTGAVSVHNRIFLRVYNPYNKRVSNLEPGQIGLCEVHQSVFPSKTVENTESRIYDIPQFPVKKRNDSFSKNDLVRIEKQLSRLERKTKLLTERVSSMKRNSLSFHRAMHKILSLQRTQLELKLSLTLCKGRTIDHIAWELNELRSKRRTYDYILELAESGRS